MNDGGDAAERPSGARFVVLAVFLFCGFGAVLTRAVYLQCVDDKSLQWVAQKQSKAVVPMARKRGKILDARGRELAVSVPVQSIFADPSAIVDPHATLDAIDHVVPLGKARDQAARRMRVGKRFAWVVRRVAPELAEVVRNLRLPGIHFVEENQRNYPNGMLASQLLGAVGYDAEPLAGVELAYQEYLSGTARHMIYERDARGRFFFTPVQGDVENAAATATPVGLTANATSAGSRDDEAVGTIVLTIDKAIQYFTEQALERGAVAAASKGAVAVVVEVETGRILAMASHPTFDPNAYADYPQDAWRNRVLTDTFEPGSTFKALIIAAALEAGVPPTQRFDCQRGLLRVGSHVLHDAHPHGVLPVADIIQVSSNIGTAKVAAVIGKERIGAALRDFGIGGKTGIDFPGEAGGVLRAAERWSPVEFATIAFGQGVTVTPLQMAMAFTALAHDGWLMRPYLVEQIRSGSGEIVHQGDPQPVRQVVSAKTAAVMRTLLQRVVEAGGTGQAAASSRYPTAGKTGTAQKVVEGRKGYAAGKYFASFVGMSPVVQPKIVVFVGLDEPKGAYYGGAVAAPIFREIVEATLQYLEVPSTDAPVLLADGTAVYQPPVTNHRLSVSGHQSPVTSHQPRVPADDAVVGFVRQDGDRIIVPNLVGLSLREVVRLTGEVPVALKVKGAGRAITQSPLPGTVLTAERPMEVEFGLPE
ncbi:MAG: transpeptidase family protein [Deltaproteobacteria bacterium]|nr:transpeptidase family protein [Deltaproteobacteria bacterium]